MSACDGDPKKLLRVVDSLLGKSVCSPLPVSESLSELAARFSTYFIEKIAAIQTSIPPVDDLQQPPAHFPASQLNNFRPLELPEIVALIKGAAPKSCELDPLPSSLVKALSSLHPTIASIVNKIPYHRGFPGRAQNRCCPATAEEALLGSRIP